MRLKLKLTVASIKMFYRQREAIIWTFLLPLFIIVLFGFVHFDGVGQVHLGVVNEAGDAGATLIARLKGVRTLEVSVGERAAQLTELVRGERDLVLVIPQAYRENSVTTLAAYGDIEAKPQETQLAGLLLQRVLDEQAFEAGGGARRTLVKTEPVATRNLTYMDFLLPGIMAMSIMQMGVFGVAFGFVSLKKRGILRRLRVTPINPNDFIFAQVTTRLIVVVLQMSLMVGVGMVFLHFHFMGNVALLALLSILGAIVFLGVGFTLAGVSSSEDQVAPLANVISLPMMALSGVFFNRSHLPGILRSATEILPLTYLADGLRSVAIDGATTAQVAPQLIGLAVWGIASCALAVRLFRWE
ncbi:MAG: ABC transporter permease [Bacteroidota bacterium]